MHYTTATITSFINLSCSPELNIEDLSTAATVFSAAAWAGGQDSEPSSSSDGYAKPYAVLDIQEDDADNKWETQM